MILERADIDRYNLTARLRGLAVRGVDKASLASLIGVSLRTVQRWFAPFGGQYRPLIPPSWAGREFTTLRRGERLRVVLGALLADDETRYCGLGIDLREVSYLLRTLADALDAIDALADGAGAVWLVCNWRRASVLRVGEAWELVIEYESERGSKARGVEVAYGVMDEPPPRGEECEGSDCPGDDWRRACCVLETRARCCAQARRVLGV